MRYVELEIARHGDAHMNISTMGAQAGRSLGTESSLVCIASEFQAIQSHIGRDCLKITVSTTADSCVAYLQFKQVALCGT